MTNSVLSTSNRLFSRSRCGMAVLFFFCLFIGSCESCTKADPKESLLPRLDMEPAQASVSPPPPPPKSGKPPPPPPKSGKSPSSIPVCKYSNSTARQDCVFTLDGYGPGAFFYKKRPRDVYAKSVAQFIKETELQEGCSLLAITAWGYADGLKYRGGLRWSAVPKVCRASTKSTVLSEDDLASVRECLVTDRVLSNIGGDIGIKSMSWKKARTNYPDGVKIGSDHRKVEHIIERTGRCP